MTPKKKKPKENLTMNPMLFVQLNHKIIHLCIMIATLNKFLHILKSIEYGGVVAVSIQ